MTLFELELIYILVFCALAFAYVVHTKNNEE